MNEALEASTMIGPGAGLTARLTPDGVEIEEQGWLTRQAVHKALPRLLHHLANRSGQAVQYDGRVYLPRPPARAVVGRPSEQRAP